MNLKQYKAGLLENIRESMTQAAKLGEREARRLCPWGEGRNGTHLRNTIEGTSKSTKTGAEMTLSASAPYAVYVELGTVKQPPAPYMRPALRLAAQKFTERMK